MSNYSSTLSSRQISRLSVQEAATRGGNTKFNVKYTDLANANATGNADTVTIKLGDTPAIWRIDNVFVDCVTALVGGNAAMTIGVGTGTNATAILAATATPLAAIGPFVAQAYGVNNYANCFASATTSLKLVITQLGATGAISSITAGELNIYVDIIDEAVQRSP